MCIILPLFLIAQEIVVNGKIYRRIFSNKQVAKNKVKYIFKPKTKMQQNTKAWISFKTQ